MWIKKYIYIYIYKLTSSVLSKRYFIISKHLVLIKVSMVGSCKESPSSIGSRISHIISMITLKNEKKKKIYIYIYIYNY